MLVTSIVITFINHNTVPEFYEVLVYKNLRNHWKSKLLKFLTVSNIRYNVDIMRQIACLVLTK